MNPILNIENLTKVYGTLPNQTRALNGITFQVMPGEFLGIMAVSYTHLDVYKRQVYMTVYMDFLL